MTLSRFSSFLVASATLLSSLSPSLAFAQVTPLPSSPQNDPSVRLEFVEDVPVVGNFLVSPTKIVKTLKPGESLDTSVMVFNREGAEITYKITIQDFAPDSRTDDIQLYLDKDGPYSARSWVKTVKEFTLKHGERATIPVSVSAPANASVGDHYTAIMIQHKEPSDGVGIGLITQVGVLFLITADGNTIKEGNLESFFSRLPIFWSRKAVMGIKYKNTGTVHLAPDGMVRIRNIFGVVVDQIPFRDWFVYRESFRTREVTWKPRFALGRYTADLEFHDAAHPNEPVTASASFWILPIVPILVVLGTVFLLSLLTQIIISRFEIRKKDDAKATEKKE
jgi:hypothetical protein